MRVVSVNVSLTREVPWRGGTVRTGIFKEPVAGYHRVGSRGIEGDEQADLRVHGAPTKAVYAYPSEHYAFWSGELPGTDLPWGAFGENLTTEGLLEGAVRVGDRYRIGTAVLEVTKPRFPCYKLGIKFGREDILPRFLHSGRSGFYFAVAREGEVSAGDPIEVLARAAEGPTIEGLVRERIRKDEAGE
ncbi:MAG: molybdenum cofactor biosysynthesis protein [Euryarchaeota archaeon RBG_16_68_12]|nr:MAG: molybdenum cofactor biosysynthesis protein [Euryarchaeota archaeon RBG_16_68_12]